MSLGDASGCQMSWLEADTSKPRFFLVYHFSRVKSPNLHIPRQIILQLEVYALHDQWSMICHHNTGTT